MQRDGGGTTSLGPVLGDLGRRCVFFNGFFMFFFRKKKHVNQNPFRSFTFLGEFEPPFCHLGEIGWSYIWDFLNPKQAGQSLSCFLFLFVVFLGGEGFVYDCICNI